MKNIPVGKALKEYPQIRLLARTAWSKAINRDLLGECLLILSLPERLLTSRALPSDSTCVLEAEPGKLDINRREPGILFIS